MQQPSAPILSREELMKGSSAGDAKNARPEGVPASSPTGSSPSASSPTGTETKVEPPPGMKFIEHTVEQNDDLTGLAMQYDTLPSLIRQYNPRAIVKSLDHLVGSKLLIPMSKDSTVVAENRELDEATKKRRKEHYAINAFKVGIDESVTDQEATYYLSDHDWNVDAALKAAREDFAWEKSQPESAKPRALKTEAQKQSLGAALKAALTACLSADADDEAASRGESKVPAGVKDVVSSPKAFEEAYAKGDSKSGSGSGSGSAGGKAAIALDDLGSKKGGAGDEGETDWASSTTARDAQLKNRKKYSEYGASPADAAAAGGAVVVASAPEFHDDDEDDLETAPLVRDKTA